MKHLLLILLCLLPIIGFGQCVGNCDNGEGTWIYSNGDKYAGEWKDGEQHGQGTYTYINGDKYVGGWRSGKMHGYGKYETSSYTYDGKYVNGKKHGQGKKTYTNGKIEEGTFKNGEFIPVLKEKYGCVSGNCENDWGVHKWSDGSSYTGHWKYGKKHGEGTFIDKWGGKYVGEWRNGKEHGQGTHTFSYGTVEKGTWIDGFYQKPKTTKKKTVKPKITPSRSSYSYSSDTYSIISYDFNNSPFNIRYSGNMYEDATGFYFGGGLKAGRTPTSSGIYEVEYGQPIMYDGDATIGSFGPKLEESQSGYYIDVGITRHLFYAFWGSAGLAYERNLVVEKREHYFDFDDGGTTFDEYWGIEWLENKDESYHKVFIETDVYVKIFDHIVVKYGIVYKNNAINSVVGVGFAF